MRMMVTARLPVEAGNRSIEDGSLGRTIEGVMAAIRPESCYFLVENGRRTMRAVFDMTTQHQMVTAFEPLMMTLDADIEITPVMLADDLARGLASLG